MSFDERVPQELAKIDNLEREHWQAWERSLAGGRPSHHFLNGVLSCIDRRIKLLGLDAPVKVDIERMLREEAVTAGLDPDDVVAAAQQIIREDHSGGRGREGALCTDQPHEENSFSGPMGVSTTL